MHTQLTPGPSLHRTAFTTSLCACCSRESHTLRKSCVLWKGPPPAPRTLASELCSVVGYREPSPHQSTGPSLGGLRVFGGGLQPGGQSEDGGPLAREHRPVPHSAPPQAGLRDRQLSSPPTPQAGDPGPAALPPAPAMGGQHPGSPPRSGSSTGPRLALCGLAWAPRHRRQLFVYGKLRSPSRGPPTNLNEGRAGLFLRPPRASCAPGRAGQAPRKRPGSPRLRGASAPALAAPLRPSPGLASRRAASPRS